MQCQRWPSVQASAASRPATWPTAAPMRAPAAMPTGPAAAPRSAPTLHAAEVHSLVETRDRIPGLSLALRRGSVGQSHASLQDATGCPPAAVALQLGSAAACGRPLVVTAGQVGGSSHDNP